MLTAVGTTIRPCGRVSSSAAARHDRAAPPRARATRASATLFFSGLRRPSPSPTRDADPPQKPAVRVPLKDVVDAAVDRWFEETLYEAQRGDVKQQALLAQMFAQGYGTPRDAKAAAKWEERSRARGYKMKGVYCELD